MRCLERTTDVYRLMFPTVLIFFNEWTPCRYSSTGRLRYYWALGIICGGVLRRYASRSMASTFNSINDIL